MALTTIEWTGRRLPDGTLIIGYTFNPWWGCHKVSQECKHCYAEGIAARYGYRVWGPAATTARRFFGPEHWREPVQWNAQAAREGHRRNVFCASMADVFEDHPDVGPAREQVWHLIEQTPWLNWLLLTKRPELIGRFAPWGAKPWPDNVWLGTSIGLQQHAAPRLEALVSYPTVVRFVSCEPLLGPLDLTPWLPALHWVICGGESGAHARPMWPAWARSLREQCRTANVPFFFKQWGGRTHAAGGRVLDGRTWDEIPPEGPVPAMCGQQTLVEAQEAGP
jgi:protein gp37